MQASHERPIFEFSMKHLLTLSQSARRSIQYPALGIVGASVFLLSACDKKEKAQTNEDTPQEAPQTNPEDTPNISPEQQKAEAIIKKHPDLEKVRIQDKKIHIQNVHTGLGLVLTFQDVIDGKYSFIEGKANPDIAPPQEPDTTPKTAHDSKDWGKVPEWVPRYPDAKVQQGAMHTPRSNGSIWGTVTFTHSDSIDKIAKTLTERFKKNGLEPISDYKEEAQMSLVFATPKNPIGEALEKRQASCSLSRSGSNTTVSIQYSYGMK